MRGGRSPLLCLALWPILSDPLLHGSPPPSRQVVGATHSQNRRYSQKVLSDR